MSNSVSFPGLGLSFTLNRVAFSVFGQEIYWYALIICFGILLAFLYALWEGKRQRIPSDTFFDLLILCLPVAIIGARLYYVFSKWDYYSQNWLQIFHIRGGGLAIYGGVIAAVIAAVIYCKVKKVNTMQLFDICSVGLLIGQGVGRWGNFVNVEAYGYETSVPWAMQIYSDFYGRVTTVHPTFFYESVWNIAGAVLLAILIRHKKRDGQIFWLYLIWYGIGRFAIEGLRTDSLMLYHWRISRIVAMLSVLLGITMSIYLIWQERRLKHKD